MQWDYKRMSDLASTEDEESWPFGRALVMALVFGGLFWGILIFVIFFE